jgi:NAD(P)H dehydrogenase (quinone)
MPAIMKGWIDRVYAWGFAYGVGEHSDRHWGDRYGEGTFVGKRAMLIVTAGGWAEHYSPRGINGPIDDILFPIQHGMLFYPGFEVLPPLVFYRTDKTDAAQFADQCATLAERLDTLWQTEPIPFRRQNHGDYLIPSLTLRPELAPGRGWRCICVANNLQSRFAPEDRVIYPALSSPSMPRAWLKPAAIRPTAPSSDRG